MEGPAKVIVRLTGFHVHLDNYMDDPLHRAELAIVLWLLHQMTVDKKNEEA